jgi:regulator of RNase E activity RraA
MSDVLSQETIAALQGLSTAAVCNAIECSALRLRNEGYIGGGVTLRTPVAKPMIGYALTLRMRTEAPPVSGLSYVDRSDWWDAFDAAPRPKIIVIEDASARVGVGSVAGETHVQIFRALGAVGLITNGAIRDMRALRGFGMPVYSAAVVPSHAYAHIVACGEPVSIGGLTINSGDLLQGDEDGIVAVPSDLADGIPAIAARLAEDERKIAAICQSQPFSGARLRIALGEVIGSGIR